jgi:hypothetical protein
MRNIVAWSRYDVLAVIVLVLGVSLFHARGLSPGQAFLPVDLANNILPWREATYQPLQNQLISDPLYEFYPFLAYAVNTVKETKTWPLWNSAIYLGHPSFADPLAQTFYPVYLGLGLVFGTARGLAIGLWLHVILAAFLMYGFLRTLQCPSYASAVGAFSYALGGHLVTWFEATHRTTTLSWLPGILWAFEVAIRKRDLRYAALGGVLFALAILGGQYQYMVTFSIFFGLYALGRTIELARNQDRQYIWPIKAIVTVMIAGGALSAIQILPFAEFLNLSHRVLSESRQDALPLKQLITLLVPNFYGNPIYAPLYAYGGWSVFSAGVIYAGLSTLALACMAPLWSRRFFVWYLFFVGLGLTYFIVGGPGISILAPLPVIKYASLHRSTFIYPLLIGTLAALGLSNSEQKFSVAVSVCVILIGIIGLALYLLWDQVEESWKHLQFSVMQAIGLVVATGSLLAIQRYKTQQYLLLNWAFAGLVFVDLFIFGSRFNPTGPIADLTPLTPAIEYLREHAGLKRIVAYQYEVLFGPNVPSIYGLAEAGGYTSVHSARYHQLVAAGNPNSWWMNENQNVIVFTQPSRRLLDLLQVGYVISPVLEEDPGIRAELLGDRCDKSSEEITSLTPTSGSFVVQQYAINRLDLHLHLQQIPPPDELLTIRLWQGNDRERLVLEAHQNITELTNQQNLTFYFSPEIDAPGHTYVWEVSTTAQDTGVSLCTDINGNPSVSVFGNEYNLVHHSGRVFIYERSGTMPRAYVVYSAEQVTDDAEAISRLLDESFYLSKSVIVAEPVILTTETDISISRADIIGYQNTQVTVNASALREGILVLGDQYYPGWKAYVDGQEAKIIRTNHVLRGVILPPGEHQVVFKLQPDTLIKGAWISGLSLFILSILCLFVWRGKATK